MRSEASCALCSLIKFSVDRGRVEHLIVLISRLGCEAGDNGTDWSPLVVASMRAQARRSLFQDLARNWSGETPHAQFLIDRTAGAESSAASSTARSSTALPGSPNT